MTTIPAPRKGGGRTLVVAGVFLTLMALLAFLTLTMAHNPSAPSIQALATPQQKVVVYIDDDGDNLDAARKTWTFLTGITEVITFNSCEAALTDATTMLRANFVLVDGRMYKDDTAGVKCVGEILALYPQLAGKVWGHSTQPELFEQQGIRNIPKDLNGLRNAFPK